MNMPMNKESLSTTDLRSMDLVINIFHVKLFKTTSMKVIQLCQNYFYFELPSVVLKKELKNRNKYNGYYYTRYRYDI